MRTPHQLRLLRQSGNVRTSDPLVCLLYLAMRSAVPFGVLWRLIEETLAEMKTGSTDFTDGHQARSAMAMVRRLYGKAGR
jgi:hypothetical protein